VSEPAPSLLPWLDDYSEVVRLGQWLVDTESFTTARELLAYFSKPWHWNDERENMLLAEAEAEADHTKPRPASTDR
jgi:hypothetical protein